VDEKPCYDSEALRRIRQVNVGGMVIGVEMLERTVSDGRI
jgi:hypothetical protein